MNLRTGASRTWFARFAWAVLAYNIPVILWGAYVRVSFSGDGCGANWPLCGGGQLIPQNMPTPRLIEFTHRAMTSVDVIVTLLLLAWAFAAFEKRHSVRRYASLAMLFLVIEALLGAGLVLLRLVAHNASWARAVYLSLHLTNTLLLLAALTATAWAAWRKAADTRIFAAPKSVVVAAAVAIAVSITGAIAALGDTLFPASSITGGLQQDFTTASSALLRLRVFHPAVAILAAAYLISICVPYLRRSEGDTARTAAARVLSLVLFQLAAGAVNIGLLAPIWMQLVHLFIADVLWIALVLLVLEAQVQASRHPVVQEPLELTTQPPLARSVFQ
jgi:cytochrome c oxidase assembly protein subunit 15/protoheme IX farnesyltransferase